MSTTNRITRRRFLGWITIIASVPIAGVWNRFSPSIDSLPHHLGKHLAKAAFRNHKSASKLGKAYLHKFPNERNLTYLINSLSVKEPQLAKSSADDGSLTTVLQQNIASDFEAGDVVVIDGWVVSQTEARLSAIASLV